MCIAIILFLISLVVNGLLAYTLHNSHWDHGAHKPFTLPLILWILIGISTLIPIVNVIATIIYVVLACIEFDDGNLKINADFWLAKRY